MFVFRFVPLRMRERITVFTPSGSTFKYDTCMRVLMLASLQLQYLYEYESRVNKILNDAILSVDVKEKNKIFSKNKFKRMVCRGNEIVSHPRSLSLGMIIEIPKSAPDWRTPCMWDESWMLKNGFRCQEKITVHVDVDVVDQMKKFRKKLQNSKKKRLMC